MTPDAQLQEIKNSETQPILQDPWTEPVEHYGSVPGDTLAIRAPSSGRRPSQPSYSEDDDSQVTQDDEPHRSINDIRIYVGEWRKHGFQGSPARKLLQRWHDCAENREGEEQPFFCQREGVETVLWLLNTLPDQNRELVLERLKVVNRIWNDDLHRVAIKMATGAGKTRTMSMLIACLEMLHPRGCRVIVIAPNTIVRDRIQELRDDTRYAELAGDSRRGFRRADIQILNFQKLQRREITFDGIDGDITKKNQGFLNPEVRYEQPIAMLKRAITDINDGLPTYVFQDEGHHCRRPGEQPKRKALKDEELDATGSWFEGVKSIRDETDLRLVVDFSATPAYLEIPRKPEKLKTALFPWTITDFAVEDAIESGICKIPRIPSALSPEKEDMSLRLRNFYEFCTDEKKIPNRWHGTVPLAVQELVRAIANDWSATRFTEYQASQRTPAVILVVNRVDNAIALYRWLAGGRLESESTDEESSWEPGAIEALSNIDPITQRPVARDQLRTLVVSSRMEATGDAPTTEQNQIAKAQLELVAPDKTAKEATDRLRDMFMSVGVRGAPGEKVRCVISVAMLSEGWDAKTVTHVMGYRRFGSALLCEQVVGRSLRRPSLDDPSRIEYAEVVGVPFPGLTVRSSVTTPPEPPVAYDVWAMPESSQFAIEWPVIERLEVEPPIGTRYDLDRDFVLGWLPSMPKPFITDLQNPLPSGGASELASETGRNQRAIFEVSSAVADRLMALDDDETEEDSERTTRRGVLFVDAKRMLTQWLNHPNIKVQRIDLLNEKQYRDYVVDHVLEASKAIGGRKARLLPVFKDRTSPTRDTFGTEFQTTLKFKYETRGNTHLNMAACHSSWEKKVAELVDAHPQIEAWVRNFRLNWSIPWWDSRIAIYREYEPDFVFRLNTGKPCHVVVEVKGEKDAPAQMKLEAAERWCKALTESDDPILDGSWHYLYLNDYDRFKEEIDVEIKRILS